jgi:hypothetical protein
LEGASSAEDDSDREPEPTTPQTAQTEFDTTSERHTDGKAEDAVRIVGSTPTPRDGELVQVA